MARPSADAVFGITCGLKRKKITRIWYGINGELRELDRKTIKGYKR